VRWKDGPAAGACALLLGAILAGCAGTPAGADATTQASGFRTLEATATTGVIRGVVVDEAIRPLANATVTAHGPDGANRTAVTNAVGFFGFEAIAPGSWFVSVRKLAYTEVQQNVEVAAGVAEPPLVKLQATLVPSQVPFANTFHVDAFVECILPGANVCAIANLYPCVFLGYCSNATADTSFVFLYSEVMPLNRVPDFLQAEIVWESTQAVSDWLNIRYSAHGPEDGAGLDERQGGIRGPSPLVMRMNETTLTKWDTGTKKGIMYEFFGCLPEWAAYLSGCAGVVLNQKVSLYFNVFYGYAPPEGWSFSGDGAPPPPPQ
jgi:hypothetical protein